MAKSNHWNTPNSVGDDKASGAILDATGNAVSDVAFTANTPDASARTIGDNNASSVSSTYSSILPDDAQHDWWYATGAGNYEFIFIGLDDSLNYTLLIGPYAPSGNATTQANRNTRWIVNGQDQDTDSNDLAGSYVTFTGLETDGSGNLVITSEQIGTNTHSVVSALQLTAVPESGASLLVGIGALMLLMRRKRD